MPTRRTVNHSIGTGRPRRLDRATEISADPRRVTAFNQVTRCQIGQATTEWLMVAGMLAAIAIVVARALPPALRMLLEGLTWGIRTIAP